MKRPKHRRAAPPKGAEPRKAARNPKPQTPSRRIRLSAAREAKLQTWAAVGFIATLVLVAFYKLTSMKGLIITDDGFASDLMNENFPYRFALGNALKSGSWPLWVREIYGGFPLLARAESGVCYPFNLVLFGLFSPYVALNLTILLTVVTAGIGMYLYTREIGSTQLASLVAGVAFGFSGYLMSHLKHLSIANAAGWLPIALMFLERAVKHKNYRSLIGFAGVLGLQHLAGNAQSAYYCTVLYLFYFTLRAVHGEREAGSSLAHLFKNKLTGFFAAALVLGTLLAAVQLLPTYEMVSLSSRSGGVSFQYASSYAYDPNDVWTFLYPYINGDPGNLTYTGKGIFWEDYGYVGAVTLLLAAYAAIREWKNWHVKFFAVTAIVSYILVLGPATPAYEVVFKYVPGMSYFRFPTRLLLMTDGSLVVLAALGLTTLARQFAGVPLTGAADRRQTRRAALIGAMALVIVTGDLLYFQIRQNPIVDAPTWMKPPETAAIIKRDSSLFRTYCVGGVHSHRRTFHQAGGWEGDLEPFVQQREFLQPSSNVLYGLASPAGYANLTPNYVVDIWGDQNRAGIITRTASTKGDVFGRSRYFGS